MPAIIVVLLPTVSVFTNSRFLGLITGVVFSSITGCLIFQGDAKGPIFGFSGGGLDPKFQRTLIGEGWPLPKYDFIQNPMDPEMVALGRKLFYDVRLSSDGKVSCGGCHSSYTAFAHVDHPRSHGVWDWEGRRNAPALMNLAWQSEFMWDGAVKHLDLQSLAPLTHRTEMDMSLDSVLAFLKSDLGYQRAFGKREINIPNMLKAFAQFELTFISRGSRYDSMKRKQIVFTGQELRGYQLFQKNCSVCHSEPLFSNPGTFASNGLPVDPVLNDKGRAEISGKPEDEFLFKIPSLRNAEVTYPYMHDGRMKTLTEVVKYYSDKTLTLPRALGGGQHVIALNSKERVDVVAFLMTLTDPVFLQNPSFQEPR